MRRVFDVACNLRSWNPKRRVNFQNGGHFKLGNGSKGANVRRFFVGLISKYHYISFITKFFLGVLP